jgi:hypothetical protein
MDNALSVELPKAALTQEKDYDADEAPMAARLQQ